MATLSQAKTYGGIGSILVLLSVVPTVGWVIAIAGLILTIIAVKYIGEIVQDPSIFRNIIIGVGVAIVGAIVVGLLVFASLFSTLGSLTGSTTFTTNASGVPVVPSVSGIIVTAIIGLAALWILLIISAIFVRKSYGTIAQRLDVGMFKTAALVYLIGAVLTIIGIGLIIVFVAQILLVVAFFSISETRVGSTMPMGSYSPSTVPPPPPPGPTGQTRTCPRCGAPVASDSVFCASCGSNLTQ